MRNLSILRNVFSLVTVILLFHLHAQSQGVWNNGQNASSVLGQLDFESAQRNQGSTSPLDISQAGPFDVAIDPTTGKVFVADSYNHRVLRYSSMAAIQNGAPAEVVLGQSDFDSNLATVSRSRFNFPGGVFVSASGVLWVCDYNNHRILRFDNASQKESGANADGVLGQPDFVSRSSATTRNGMNYPGVAVEDADGRLWVADSFNSRILRFNSAASRADGVNADGVLGQSSYTTATTGTTATTMNGPSGLAISPSGTLWVSDSFNHRILRFSGIASKPSGTAADGVLGQSDFTSSDSATTSSGFSNTEGLTLDASGRLWVADRGNKRVVWFNTAENKGDGAAADGVLGQPNFTTSTHSTDPSHFVSYGLSADGSNRLWVADYQNSRILRFDADRSAERAALNRQIISTKRAIRKLKKNIKKASKKKQSGKAKRLKRKLKSLNRKLPSQHAALASL